MKSKNSKFKTFYLPAIALRRQLQAGFLFVFLLFAFCFLLLNARHAAAQELGVSINPPIIQAEATAPAIINSSITVQNNSDQTINYGIFLMPFKASSSLNGEPEFDRSLLESYKEFFKRVQISDKDKVISEIALAPGQKKELTLRIAVTKEIPIKDYYFSVLFITKEESSLSENSFVGTRAGIAANVLLTLEPKSKTSGYIKKFDSPYFVTRGPVDFELNLANTSRHFISIQGNVVIKNIFGQTVGNLDLVPVNILGNSERLIETENNKNEVPRLVWNEEFLLGVYTADMTVSLSEEGPLLKRSLTFVAIPLEIILGVLVALILLSGIVKRIRSKQQEA